MSNPKYDFQYCPKLIVFSADWQKVLLAKRKGEADYNGTFTFIGGKMEVTDKTILAGLKREKDEEIGSAARLKVYPISSNNLLYTKNDGLQMIIPHYLAYYLDGNIALSQDEYSEYKWVSISKIKELEPKIENIPIMVDWALGLRKIALEADFIEL
jgi:NADH pyrophosphatase NudC (nudix superfamily)